MSHVVVATGFGGPEVLAVVDEPVAAPGPGEIRIAVRAAGVNPVDYKSYSGAYGADPSQLPIRLGLEAAGVVTAVGADAVGPAGPIAVGDEVIGYRLSGAYAAELVAAAAEFVPKPTELDWAQAAGLLLTGGTAVHTLTATDVSAGDIVLIHGASGGVGVMAVQLAVSRGARVIATASPARHGFLRELGAEPVAYGDGLADRVRGLAPSGADVALDLIGTDEAVDVSLEVVADRHRIATIAAFGRAAADGIQLLGGGPGSDPGTDTRNASRLELVHLVQQGRLRVFVAERFPLARVADAHRSIMTGHTAGKIALVN
ncbi:MAG: NADP-dependent oxidoreductase [Jatrophihabitantaceae bacterium]